MHRSYSLVAMCLALCLVQSQADAKERKVKVLESYQGPCWMPNSRTFPGPQGGKAEKKPTVRHKVIQNAKEWERFVKRLPKRTITKRSPAPPSRDPVLKLKPDFSKVTALVVFRANTLMGKPKIKSVTKSKRTIWVRIVEPKIDFPEAMPIGIGVYRLILIKKTKAKVRFVFLGENKKQEGVLGPF